MTGLTLVEQATQTSRTLSNGEFHNFQLPSFPDLSKLIAGATGNPRTWLQDQVQVRLSHELIWAHGSVTYKSCGCTPGGFKVEVRIFNLDHGKEGHWNYNNSNWRIGTNCGLFSQTCTPATLGTPAKNFLRLKYGGVLFLRYLAPGESYWW